MYLSASNQCLRFHEHLQGLHPAEASTRRMLDVITASLANTVSIRA